VSIVVDEVSLVLLDEGVVAAGGWELARKFSKLPSHLEGPDFLPGGAMVGGKVHPERVGVLLESWRKDLIKDWW